MRSPNAVARKTGVRLHIESDRSVGVPERIGLAVRRAFFLSILAVEAGWFVLLAYIGLRLLG